MSIFELKFLTLALLGIDIVIIVVFVIVIRRLRYFKKNKSFEKTNKVFQSFLADADKIATQFNDQLEEKHRLIKRLNEQLDKRISSLNILLNRADILLSSGRREVVGDHDKVVTSNGQQKEIIAMAREGCQVEEIADRLSIPKGEVKLVLGLKKTFSRAE